MKIKTFNVTWNEKHSVVVKAKNEDEAKEKVQNCFASNNSEEVSKYQAIEIKNNYRKCEGCGEDILPSQAVIEGENRHSICS